MRMTIRRRMTIDDDDDNEETSMMVGAEQMLRLGEGGATKFWSSKALENANIYR